MNLNIQTNQFNLPVRIQIGKYKNNKFSGVIWHSKNKHPKKFLSLIHEFEVTHVKDNIILNDSSDFLENEFFHKCYKIKEKEIITEHFEEGINLHCLSVKEDIVSDSEIFNLPFEKEYKKDDFYINNEEFLSKVFFSKNYFNYQTRNKKIINHLIDYCNIESFITDKNNNYFLNKSSFGKNLRKC